MSICTVLFLRIERSSSGLSNTVNSVVSFGRICETQNGHIVIHDTASYLFLYISIYIHIQYDSLKLISNQIAVDCFFTLQWYTKLTSQSSTLYVLLWYGVIHLFLLHYTHSARTSDRTKYWSHKDDIGGKFSANESWLSIRISISLQIWTRPACEYAIWYIKQVDSDQTLDYIFIPPVLHV